MKKIAALPRQDSAVGFYRIVQPTMFANRLELTKKKSYITRFTGTGQMVRLGQGEDYKEKAWGDEVLMKMAQGSDVIWSNMILTEEEILKMLDLREWSGAKWIVDIDDNMYSVSSDNPGKNSSILLKDRIELCLSLADGVTTTVPSLKKLYKDLNPNIHVMPNFVDPKWFKPGKKKKNETIRIGWRGAYGHRSDITLARPALEALAKNYDIQLVTYGVKPPFDSEHHEWSPLFGNDTQKTKDFPDKLKALNLDIAIVPLVDSDYNRCKSNLAIQEFSALKIPIVASPVLNQDNHPILYAKDNHSWYNQLEKLIKDEKLRKSQAKRQLEHMKNIYDGEKIVKQVIKWMDKLPRKDLKPDLKP